MELSKLEKAVRHQIPIGDFHSLKSVLNPDMYENMPLQILCGMWEDSTENGRDSFCKYYDISPVFYDQYVEGYKNHKKHLRELYKKFIVIDNSVLSLIYNFNKITGHDLIKLISVKKICRAAIKKGVPNIPYDSIRFAIKEQLVRNYLAF